MPTALEDLTAVSQLLHLSFHRNKNQHRLSKWWSSLSQLKRHAQKLITELEALEVAEKFDVTGNSGKKGKKANKGEKEGSKYVKAAREKVELRVEFMETWLLPGCYLAFSNLIADNQYAPLGLVLMGTLAKIKRVIRPLGPVRVASLEDDKSFIELESTSAALVGHNEPKADLGEVVSREELGKVIARSTVRNVEDHDAAIDEDDDEEEGVQLKKGKKKRKPIEAEAKGKGDTEGKTEEATTKRPKKKRKKGGDAFDDLFSSLM